MTAPDECDIHEGDVMVVAFYQQDVIGYNPKTKQRLRPPRTLIMNCREEDAGVMVMRIAALNRSTGWYADIKTERLFR